MFAVLALITFFLALIGVESDSFDLVILGLCLVAAHLAFAVPIDIRRR